MVEFFYEEVSNSQIQENVITAWINKVVKEYKFELGDITYIFCNDEYILDINRKYLNHDYYTDVITFDYTDNNHVSGDVFISLDTVKSNSSKFEQEFYNELHRVIIHGILHLIGFKDKTTEEDLLMRAEENRALEILKTIS